MQTVLDVAQDSGQRNSEFAQRVLEDTLYWYKICASLLENCMQEKGQPMAPRSCFSQRQAMQEQAKAALLERFQLEEEEESPELSVVPEQDEDDELMRLLMED